jgi:proline iminopeptidase
VFDFENPLANRHAYEMEAIQVLERRMHKAPSLSSNQLKNMIFGSFQSDAEFQLVMHAAAPLYSESFDADAALAANLKTVYFAESHSKVIVSDLQINMANASR